MRASTSSSDEERRTRAWLYSQSGRDVRLVTCSRRGRRGWRPSSEGGGDEDAEQDGEELVDPAAAALHLVQAVEVEHRRPEERDQGQEEQVARERGHALGTRAATSSTSVGMEAEEVGEEPGQDRGDHVHQDEHGDHEPGLGLHHVGGVRLRTNSSARASSTKARKRASNTWRLWASARARSAAVLNRRPPMSQRRPEGEAARRFVEDHACLPGKSPTPRPPPSAKTTAGRPQAMASRGTIPKSSTLGHDHRPAAAVEVAQGRRRRRGPGTRVWRPARARSRAVLRTRRRRPSGGAARPRYASRTSSIRL